MLAMSASLNPCFRVTLQYTKCFQKTPNIVNSSVTQQQTKTVSHSHQVCILDPDIPHAYLYFL